MRRRIVSSIVSFALSLSVLTAISIVTAPPANALTIGTGSGLFAMLKNGAETYATIPTDMKFSDRCGSTILATVDFNWSTAMPAGATSCGTLNGSYIENYSAMITGYLLAPATGTFTFKSRNDDGFVVNINGQTVISSWAGQGAVDFQISIQTMPPLPQCRLLREISIQYESSMHKVLLQLKLIFIGTMALVIK